MMKIIPLFLFFFSLDATNAQTTYSVASSCTGSDSIVKKYLKDADRLAVRRVYHDTDTYKDSITIKQVLRGSYLGALIAVYNTTVLPVRDTVVNLLNLHTNLNPELNFVSIKANPSLSWMDNLKNSVIPTGNSNIDYMMTRYHLQLWAYYQTSFNDKVVFKADSNWNLLPLAKSFTLITGVSNSDVETGYDDEKNITDTTNANFIKLSYSFGWGTCANGCDFRQYWHFKVYNDCSVEYLGTTGDDFTVGITKNYFSKNSVKVYPNPFKDEFHIESEDTTGQHLNFEILNVLGQAVYSSRLIQNNQEMNIGHLPTGIYFLKIKDNTGGKVIKLVKE